MLSRAADRAWAFLGEYPLTLLGICVGVVAAVCVTLVLQLDTRRDVQRLETRVVVVERQGQQTRHRQLAACDLSKPSSRACVNVRRELRRVVLTPAERRAIREAITRPKQAPARPERGGTPGRVNTPARPTPTPGTPATSSPEPTPRPAPPHSAPPRPSVVVTPPGAKVDAPPVADVQLGPDGLRVDVLPGH